VLALAVLSETHTYIRTGPYEYRNIRTGPYEYRTRYSYGIWHLALLATLTATPSPLALP